MDNILIKKLFEGCENPEQRYERLIALGRSLSSFPDKEKEEKNLVRGCQSQMYLIAHAKEDKLYFEAWSDALISKGLAALLLKAYNGQTAEFILKEKPFFLEELGILASLTPSRSNGVQALYLKMQQLALQHIVSRQTEV